MARVADHVYDHLLAVSRSASVARGAAVDVVARSPRSLAGALAAARVRALEEADDPPDAGGGETVPAGLLELVWLLAATRPAGERSIADLSVRHGLDRAALGRARGRAPAIAAAEADAVLDGWERDFRPALVAFLGPGECDGLRTILSASAADAPLRELDTAEGTQLSQSPGESAGASSPAPPPALGQLPASATGQPAETTPGAGTASASAGAPTVEALLAVAPAVGEHLERCDVCPDRVRAMASVRSLLAQVPIASAPPGLQIPPWRRRPLRPIAERTMPGDDADAGRRRTRRRRVVAVGGAAVVVAAAVAAVVIAAGGDGNDEVAVLTKVPARNALAAVPDEVHPGQVFLLESTVDHPVRWRVRPGEPWVHVEPRSGVLAPRRTSEVEVRLGDAAPEGELRVDLTISGADGSTVLVRLRGSVEHPPTVAATADGCAVAAQVEDESEVASVELHWRDAGGAVGRRRMAADAGRYEAAAPAAATPLRWWVTAVDGRGNRARSAERALDAC